MGTGSGILAIAGRKLGIADVTAIDHDPRAVAACIENARINRVEIAARRDETPPPDRFDLVVANILAQPLIAMANALAETVAHDLILSGLLSGQERAVIDAYAARGLRPVAVHRREGWSMLHLARDIALEHGTNAPSDTVPDDDDGVMQ